MTKQQAVIWEIINNSKEHPSAEMVYQKAKELVPKISAGTVYRNLSDLTQKGLIRRIPVQNSPDRFDFNTTEHAHAICQTCGKVTDIFEDDIINRLKSTVEGDILSVEIDVYYICKNCQN